MSSAGKGWNIVEGENYDRAIAQVGSHQDMDTALAAVMYALNRNPAGFPQTDAFGIYLAKTKIRVSEGYYIPSYRLWFKVDGAARDVTLLWVDLAPAEDMGFGDIFSEKDDDIPF